MMKKNKTKQIIAMLMALVVCISMVPTAFAAQEEPYHDPAEHWKTSNNRTVELDVNAHVSHETFYCAECGKMTGFTVWRTPEYTRDGNTALSRNVLYSDGTMIGGEGKGSILDGTPGLDAYYTGFHFTKAKCDTCGTLNSNMGKSDYCYNRNVYYIYDCAAEFMEVLDEETAVEYVDDVYHKVTTHGGEYCVFCYGTRHTHESRLERHDLHTDVIPQPAHNRFAIVEHCETCDYARYEFVAAKSVIADYYGVTDGQPHTITVSDLSEAGVSTQIRYGSSAESCTLTSAPNYTEAGQYNVYYAITYNYKGESMVENGVAKVWLRDDATNINDGNICGCGCGEKDCDCESGTCKNCKHSDCAKGNHNYVLLDKISPTCLELGYSRYFCSGCGNIEKRDYVNAIGHAWQSVVIREATCEMGGKTMEICRNCGDVKVTETPKGEHKYKTYKVEATCTSPGYTVKECSVCGDRHITDIVNAKPHSYKPTVIPATCETGGKTVHSCVGCGSSFVTDYTQPLGHSWDVGTEITGTTCDGSGVTEYRCTRCGYHRLEGNDAAGHKPGPDATCTEPQLCTVCNVILKLPIGHKPTDWIIDREPTTEAEGEKHIECEHCHEVLEKASIEKLYLTAITDKNGEAVVGGYLVIVTDTDTAAPVPGATVTLNKNGSIAVRLPDGRILDYADQTTVTVKLVKDKSPVKDLLIAVTDKNGNYSAGVTNVEGYIIVPGTSGKTNDNGKATVGGENPDGDRYTLTIRVIDFETGRPIEGATVSIGKTGNITVILPDGTDMDKDNRITVIVTDNKNTPQEGLTVIVKNDLGNTADGKTDKNGEVTVPYVAVEVTHGAYILGYPDGTFGPARNMTRSEAAAIFARLLSERKGESIATSAQTKFEDVPANAWYAGYVKYLTGYGVITGITEKTFAPNQPVTRAEFTAMAVRFFEVYGAGNAKIMEQYASFNDVSEGNWAAKYIEAASMRGWVKGYEDGSFRAGNDITRAEVVTLVNRLLDRTADEVYVSKNIGRLVTFSDIEKGHWAYYAVMEAANGHTASMGDSEVWASR